MKGNSGEVSENSEKEALRKDKTPLKRRISILSALLLFSLCFSPVISSDAAATVRTYTMEDSNSQIHIGIGEIFNVSLKENPSTGYEWKIKECDYSVLEVVKDWLTYYHSPPGWAGAGGVHHWTFKGIRDGKASLKMIYWQPFAGEKSTDKEFTLEVTVGNPEVFMLFMTGTVISLLIIMGAVVILGEDEENEGDEPIQDNFRAEDSAKVHK